MFYFEPFLAILDSHGHSRTFWDILGHCRPLSDILRHSQPYSDIPFRKSLLRSDLYCPCFFFFISSETASMIP